LSKFILAFVFRTDRRVQSHQFRVKNGAHPFDFAQGKL
jgi:hypothetical protein